MSVAQTTFFYCYLLNDFQIITIHLIAFVYLFSFFILLYPFLLRKLVIVPLFLRAQREENLFYCTFFCLGSFLLHPFLLRAQREEHVYFIVPLFV